MCLTSLQILKWILYYSFLLTLACSLSNVGNKIGMESQGIPSFYTVKSRFHLILILLKNKRIKEKRNLLQVCQPRDRSKQINNYKKRAAKTDEMHFITEFETEREDIIHSFLLQHPMSSIQFYYRSVFDLEQRHLLLPLLLANFLLSLVIQAYDKNSIQSRNEAVDQRYRQWRIKIELLVENKNKKKRQEMQRNQKVKWIPNPRRQ